MVHGKTKNRFKKIDYEQLINSTISTLLSLSYTSIKIQKIKEF